MEEKRIIEIQKSVIKALGELRLKKAIETLGEGIEELQDWGLRSRFNELQTAYSYMLEYLRRGMPDPDRELLHDKLMGECFIINDLIAISRLSEHSMKVYCQMRRKYHGADDIEHIHIALKENTANIEVTKALPPEECRNIAAQLSKEHEQLLPKLFAAIWSSIAWSKSDAERIFNIVTDSELSINDRATISGAIMLSAMKCFEPLKVTTLCRLAMHHESLLSTRAIVAVAILLFPSTILSLVGQANLPAGWVQDMVLVLNKIFNPSGATYYVIYFLMIVALTFFYASIMPNMQPKEIAENLKKYGSSIPGIKPGRPTAEALDKILTKTTFIGAMGLGFIALVPAFASYITRITTLQGIGATSLIIMVGVALDLINQVKTHLLARNYESFLKE